MDSEEALDFGFFFLASGFVSKQHFLAIILVRGPLRCKKPFKRKHRLLTHLSLSCSRSRSYFLARSRTPLSQSSFRRKKEQGANKGKKKLEATSKLEGAPERKEDCKQNVCVRMVCMGACVYVGGFGAVVYVCMCVFVYVCVMCMVVLLLPCVFDGSNVYVCVHNHEFASELARAFV